MRGPYRVIIGLNDWTVSLFFFIFCLWKINIFLFFEDPVQRPVLVVGPLSDWVVDKLTIDFPQQFQRCSVTPMNCNQETVENMKQNNIIVDYRIRGNIFEVTTVKSIRDVCESVSEIYNLFFIFLK